MPAKPMTALHMARSITRYSILLSMLGLSLPLLGADVVNGQRINDYCALCHGVYGQGAPGNLSPRIAGMPKEYLIKAMKDHRDAKRMYPLMVRASGLDQMSEADYEDVASYLADLDLSRDQRFDVVATVGSAAQGKEIYWKDCRSCHARDGYGRPKKKAPPLAGQHPDYLYTTMQAFKENVRTHGDEEDDDTFDEIQVDEIADVAAFVSTMDDQKIVEGYEFTPPVVDQTGAEKEAAAKGPFEIADIDQKVVKLQVRDGLSTEDVAAAMQLKAAELNLKLSNKRIVSDELRAKGMESPHLSSYQFCDPTDTGTLLASNPLFFAYLPCRISMVEDSDGKTWLMMLNMDMLVDTKPLPNDVIELAVKINRQMLDIMLAGATGEIGATEKLGKL